MLSLERSTFRPVHPSAVHVTRVASAPPLVGQLLYSYLLLFIWSMPRMSLPQPLPSALTPPEALCPLQLAVQYAASSCALRRAHTSLHFRIPRQ